MDIVVQLRQKADYNSIAEVTEEEVLEMAPLSHDFIESLEQLLEVHLDATHQSPC